MKECSQLGKPLAFSLIHSQLYCCVHCHGTVGTKAGHQSESPEPFARLPRGVYEASPHFGELRWCARNTVLLILHPYLVLDKTLTVSLDFLFLTKQEYNKYL